MDWAPPPPPQPQPQPPQPQPPPTLQTGTTRLPMQIGSGRYSVVITYDMEMAVSWVRKLFLLELAPPVRRMIGVSFHSREFLTDYGVRLLDVVTFSFFSQVLVIQLSPPTVDGAASFPDDFRRFLLNPWNLFTGVRVGEASRELASRYGLWLWRTMELGEAGTGEQPHLELARSRIGWIWPVNSSWPWFAVETSVLSQLLGHCMLGNQPWR